MSNEILTAVWKFAPCQNAELLVLVSMADQANDNGVCWPGLTSLMQRSRESRATIYRVISALQEKGIIEELREGDENHPNIKTKSRVWRIKPVDEWEPLMSEGDELSQFETPRQRKLSQDETRTQRLTSKEVIEPSVLCDEPSAVALKPVEKWTSRELGIHFRQSAQVKAKSIATMNVTIVAKFFAQKKKEGFSSVEMKRMIDVFFLDYDRFKRDGIAPWRCFLANTATLQDRARRIESENRVVSGDLDYILGKNEKELVRTKEYYLQ